MRPSGRVPAAELRTWGRALIFPSGLGDNPSATRRCAAIHRDGGPF
jgi:hypothetical protein